MDGSEGGDRVDYAVGAGHAGERYCGDCGSGEGELRPLSPLGEAFDVQRATLNYLRFSVHGFGI